MACDPLYAYELFQLVPVVIAHAHPPQAVKVTDLPIWDQCPEKRSELDEILISNYGRARPSLSIMIDPKEYISLLAHSRRYWTGILLTPH